MERVISVIAISSPLRQQEALDFARHFKDLFTAKFVFSGQYDTGGSGKKYPKYYVVREPKEGETIADFILNVKPQELLGDMLGGK